MIPPVSTTFLKLCIASTLIVIIHADYEQQRLHLLHKHGIDLEDSRGGGSSDGMRTRRLDRKEVERLMGGGDGQSGIFTWRERNRRKVPGTYLAFRSN